MITLQCVIDQQAVPWSFVSPKEFGPSETESVISCLGIISICQRTKSTWLPFGCKCEALHFHGLGRLDSAISKLKRLKLCKPATNWKTRNFWEILRSNIGHVRMAPPSNASSRLPRQIAIPFPIRRWDDEHQSPGPVPLYPFKLEQETWLFSMKAMSTLMPWRSLNVVSSGIYGAFIITSPLIPTGEFSPVESVVLKRLIWLSQAKPSAKVGWFVTLT